MAPVLASSSCCHRFFEHLDQGRLIDDFSFSGSISIQKFSRLEASANNSTKTKALYGPPVEARWMMKADRYGTEQAAKMVPTKDLMKGNGASHQKPELVNRKKTAVNGANLVRRVGTSRLFKSQKRTSKESPFTDELEVLDSDEGFSWASDNYSAWQRTIDIWTFVLSLRLRVLFDNAKWTYLNGFTEEEQKIRRQKTASWLREQILQLGPTFIKLAQLSSVRSDLFPREFVDELAKLQDRVPAFSPEKARAFIQSELGSPVDELFKEFEDCPIAAASLGQVHGAALHNGERVAVKVQRPGLKKLFDIDCRILKLVAEYFQRSETFKGVAKDWIAIYDECTKILYQEIDYINEGKNADRFRREFRKIKWVRVPLIHWDYTSTKVLTLEYVPGIKINNLDQIDARGFNHSLIARRAIESYLIQILKTGYFHADPHPGNLAIDMDGSLIYYDFGMMGEIKSCTRERLLGLLYAVYEKDENKVMRCLIDIKALQPTGDLSPVKRSIQFFLDNLLSQRLDQQQTLAAIGEDLFAMVADQTFCFPTTLTFVMKAFSTIEGIGYTLDPKFSFVKIAAPFAQELLDMRQKQRSGAELVEEIQKQANEARDYTFSMPYRIQRIEEFAKQLESGDLKLCVRVLESERAARKASILHMATMFTAMSGTLLNVGVTLSSQGNQVIANGSFIGAGILLTLAARSMKRVKSLDKFEKMI